MSSDSEKSFIDRRLVWLEDYKATVSPIDARISWAQEGIKDYGLLLVRNMFVLNAGALIAAPAYASAMKAKAQLIGILQGPITLYVIGLLFGVISAVAAYYNFSKSMEQGVCERNLEAFKLNELHFPTDNQDVLTRIKAGKEQAQREQQAALDGIRLWYRISHIAGWASFISFGLGSVLFMLKLAE